MVELGFFSHGGGVASSRSGGRGRRRRRRNAIYQYLPKRFLSSLPTLIPMASHRPSHWNTSISQQQHTQQRQSQQPVRRNLLSQTFSRRFPSAASNQDHTPLHGRRPSTASTQASRREDSPIEEEDEGAEGEKSVRNEIIVAQSNTVVGSFVQPHTQQTPLDLAIEALHGGDMPQSYCDHDMHIDTQGADEATSVIEMYKSHSRRALDLESKPVLVAKIEAI